MKYKTFPSSLGLYFTSSVIAKHKCIFCTDELAMIPLPSLQWFREESFWKLYAFCLMPSHLHLVIRLLKKVTIEKVMGEFQKFTGHELVKLFKANNDQSLLTFFEQAALGRKDRRYLIWEDSVARTIERQNVFMESVEYVHNNPVNKNWKLVETRADYRYSSACYYDRGSMPIIPIDDVGELL